MMNIFAQEKSSDKAFSKIIIGGNYVWNSSMGDIQDYWTTGSGLDGFLQTPFYAGNIKLSLTYLPFEGKDEYHPNFESYYINFGWSENLDLVSGISLNAGAKIGSFMMSFQDDTLNAFRSSESEIGAAAEVGLSFGLSSALDFNISADFLTVFTSRRIKLFNIHAGLSYAFNSPKWMREAAE
jgi:hypothetical protein